MTSPVNRKIQTGLIIIGLVVLLPLLFYPWDNRYYPRSLRAFWDLGHVILFAALVFVALCFWQRLVNLSLGYRLVLAAGFALLAGGLIEVVQFYLGRDASLYDLSLDVLGAVLAVSWYPKHDFYRYPASAVFRWLCTLAILACFIPAALYLYDEYAARQGFPVLADFTTPLQTGRFDGNAEKEWTDNSLRLYLTTDHYSGFTLKHFPRDWNGYREVVLELYNPGNNAIRLTCRIHDMAHNDAYEDRFNGLYRLSPGHGKIRIDLDDVKAAPKTRSMNLARVGALGCFTTDLATPAVLYIQSVYLR